MTGQVHSLVFFAREGPRPNIGQQLPNTASQTMRGIGLESSPQRSARLFLTLSLSLSNKNVTSPKNAQCKKCSTLFASHRIIFPFRRVRSLRHEKPRDSDHGCHFLNFLSARYAPLPRGRKELIKVIDYNFENTLGNLLISFLILKYLDVRTVDSQFAREEERRRSTTEATEKAPARLRSSERPIAGTSDSP